MSEAGTLRLLPLAPNPAGSLDALFAITGDPAGGPATIVDTAALGDSAARPGTRRLRLFHFNDLHNYLQAPDAVPGHEQLFSRIVRRYRQARADAAPDEIVLLLSGGDDHTGTPFDELLGWSADELLLDPAYAAYSAAGVEAATLGNHDLDRGAAVLRAGIARSAAFPILSANVHGSTELIGGRDFFPGALALARGLRIGLIGLTTPVDTRTSPDDPGLRVDSPLATLRRMLPAVAALADVVIVMSHCGYGVDRRDAGVPFGAGYLAEGDVALARLAASLTTRPVLVLGGHTHTVLNAGGLGPATLIDGVPILQAGGLGSHVGEFEATLQLGSDRGHWSIGARLHLLRGGPRGPVPSGTNGAYLDDGDADFERQVIAPMSARVQRRADEVLATVDDAADISRETTLRQRYMGECALLNFICDALVARSAGFPQGPAVLAMVNSTAIGDGLASGRPVTFRDWYRVQPFADTLQVGEVTGVELWAILQSNARRIVRAVELAGPTALDLHGYVSRGFLHFSRALRYRVRLGPGARDIAVTEAAFAGRPLEAMRDTRLRVVLTNYLGAGGYAESWSGSAAGATGQDPGFDLRTVPTHDTGLVFRNEVMSHIRKVGHIGQATGALLDGRLALD